MLDRVVNDGIGLVLGLHPRTLRNRPLVKPRTQCVDIRMIQLYHRQPELLLSE
jgi:hypothetical protein